MKRRILLILILLPLIGHAREKRNLLTDNYNRAEVAEFCENNLNWVKYPAYTDRAAWNSLPEEKRRATIAAGERFLGFEWPSVLPTMYLEFTRTGNRGIVDSMINARLTAIRSLFYAEMVEGMGRFIDDIVNGLFVYCEQTFWGSSAHFYLYEYGSPISEPTTILPDAANPIIDLNVGDVASTLSWIWFFLHEEFEKISPVINQRLLSEMKSKILDPYYTRNDFWWITGWNSGNVNNWTPWCSYNMLTSILLLETDKEKRLDGIYKTMRSVDLFINSYPTDGGCSEGPSYWGASVGKLYEYLTLLKACSGGRIDVFGEDIIREMGRYIHKMYIGGGDCFVNFADAPARFSADGVMIARYGQDVGDASLEGFGAFLAEQSGAASQPIAGDVGGALAGLFGYAGSAPPAEALMADAYLPDLQVAVGRDKKNSTEGFFFAAKGGHNAEQHNHNDVGSFILYYDGEPVFVDPGVGTYTRQTFSLDRWKIWTMQSGYHNLPVINGVMQSPGEESRAKVASFRASRDRVSFSADIAVAYPEEAGVAEWVRTYCLQRGVRFTVTDRYSLTRASATSAVVFMTPLPPSRRGGAVELSGRTFKLILSPFPSQADCRIEEVCLEDPKLRRVWGEMLYRIVYEVRKDALKNELKFEVKAVR